MNTFSIDAYNKSKPKSKNDKNDKIYKILENYISKVNNDKNGDTKEQKIKKIKSKWSKKPLVKEPSTGAELDYIYNMMVSDTSDGFRNKAIRKDKNNNKKLTDGRKKAI